MRRLRLRERASLLVLSIAVAIGGLLSQVAATASLDRDALTTAEADRSAQLGLDAYMQALSTQRIALQSYLLSNDAGRLVDYRTGGAEAAERRGALTSLAVRAGIDAGPLQAAARRWQAWADTIAARPAAAVTQADLRTGDGLFAAAGTGAARLQDTLDAQTVGAVARGRDRALVLTMATPALGALLLALLLLLWWQVVRSILRPIDQLADSARAISRGAASEIPGLAREDELGQLARALAAWRREAAHRLDLANAVAAEKERQARTLELLNAAVTAASGVLEPAALEQLLVEKAGILLRGADAVLVREVGAAVELVAWNGDEPPPDVPSAPEGVIGECLRIGTPVVAEDYAASAFVSGRGLARGVRSAAAVPLVVGGRPSGVLAAFTREEPRLGERDLQVLALLAAQTAPALDAARLHSELLRAHDDLTASNERLALASAHKSEFLAAMSHELRTPLNAIMGFSELMLDRDDSTIDPRKRTTFLRHIHNNGLHLLRLINEVLDLAKVEAGQMDLRSAPFDVEPLVSSVRSTVEPLAAKSGIELMSCCPCPLPLTADEDKVRQMLLNLVSNAIKFTPRAGRVQIEGRRDGDLVVLSVSDSGIGIAAEDLERIFEEFAQVGDAASGGTGLGLPLTRRLAELHGGRVWVESQPGRGSRFVLELPAGASEERVAAAAAAGDR